MMLTKQFTFHAMGDHVLNIKFEDLLSVDINTKVQILRKRIESLTISGIEEMIPTMNTLSVIYNPLMIDIQELQDKIKTIDLSDIKNSEEEKTTIHIPVTFADEYAPDIAWICSETGLTKNEFIDILTSKDYYVYMIGFIAAAPYMGDTDERIRFPRRKTPRVKVKKGTISIAEKMTNIYTLESPGGWHLVGWTPIDVFNCRKSPPSRLKSGYYVKYDPISKEMAENWSENLQSEWDEKWHQ
ncbi:allophanate hydrolase subunit 1 [Sporolactobacillus sp. THM7-4]|nr:allophanate hydrolase subunit 1 [Sporolactobacillus sp. THM7-4]